MVVDNLFYALSVRWRNCKLVASYFELHSVRVLLGHKPQYVVTEHARPHKGRDVFLIKVKQVAIQIGAGAQGLSVHRHIGKGSPDCLKEAHTHTFSEAMSKLIQSV